MTGGSDRRLELFQVLGDQVDGDLHLVDDLRRQRVPAFLDVDEERLEASGQVGDDLVAHRRRQMLRKRNSTTIQEGIFKIRILERPVFFEMNGLRFRIQTGDGFFRKKFGGAAWMAQTP